MDEKQFAVVVEKMDKILKLLALQYLGDKKGMDAVKSLAAAGFQQKDIAELIGTTTNTVGVTLNRLKKKQGGKNAGKQK
jgi:hypothetical protein